MVQSPAEESAFRAVYDRYFDDVSRYCLRRLPLHDAHDATAEVFAVVWRRLDSVPPTDAALPWLYAVARNVVRNISRARRRTLRLLGRLRTEPQYPQPGADFQLVRNEQDQAVLEAVRTLRAADQEVLFLVAYEQLTAVEISTVLGCSEAAAKKRVSRALGRLRRVVTQEQPVIAFQTKANREGAGP